jgi:hypothetical protein
MLISIQKREKNQATGSGSLGCVKEILLASPIHWIAGSRIGGPGCGGVNHSLLPLQGIVQTLGIKEIAPGELTPPLLKESSFPWGPNHATHGVAVLQRPFGDLPPQRARATHHQYPHERSTKPG